jgi:hypothetical protein
MDPEPDIQRSPSTSCSVLQGPPLQRNILQDSRLLVQQWQSTGWFKVLPMKCSQANQSIANQSHANQRQSASGPKRRTHTGHHPLHDALHPSSLLCKIQKGRTTTAESQTHDKAVQHFYGPSNLFTQPFLVISRTGVVRVHHKLHGHGQHGMAKQMIFRLKDEFGAKPLCGCGLVKGYSLRFASCRNGETTRRFWLVAVRCRKQCHTSSPQIINVRTKYFSI